MIDEAIDPAGATDTVALLSGFDRHVLLMTGRAVRVRAAGRPDIDALRRFYAGLSDRSAYLRFFGMRPAIPDEWLVPADGFDVHGRIAIMALDADEIIGVGEYWCVPGRREAEVAFAVADRHQHEGVATLLLEDLALVARAAGLERLVAVTLAANTAMRLVFGTVGLSERVWYDAGEVHVELDLTGEAMLEDEAAGRDWSATIASLRPVLAPGHVAVIGAGRRPDSPGRLVLANLLAGYDGRISVVHRTEREIDGVHAVPSIAEVLPPPDLAVIAVPAAHVLDVVDACGRVGVGAVVIITAGFAEAGDSGVEAERSILETARRSGMRVVGPNCLGVVSTAHGLNATFMRQRLVPGPVAVASQSGGVGIVIATEAARRRLGISSFVSLGNKIDVSGNDLLRYWADDPATEVALLYLESIGDPRKFARIARSVSRRLPIVALKSGRSEAGERGARSHTAALATDDVAIDALFAHTGVIRVDTLDELLDVGTLLAHEPAPNGRRVALVGNAGGPLILAADAAAANGLDVVTLSDGLQVTLRTLVPDAASTLNPVDLLATVDPSSMSAAVAAIAASGEVDACAVVHVSLGDDAAPPLEVGSEAPAIPTVAALMSATLAACPLPTYPNPERAIRALGHAARRGVWLSTTSDERLDVDTKRLLRTKQHVRRLAADAGPGRWLAADDTFALLDELELPLARWAVGTSGAACARHAEVLGFPCALKAEVDGVLHKSEAGAVKLGLGSATAVRQAVAEFRRRFGDSLRRVVVQQQAAPGIEILAGIVRDPAVGPLVVVAAGGTMVELVGDRTVSLAPLTRSDARLAIERLRIHPLFAGFRGRPAVATEPLAEIVYRLGLLAAAAPEVTELDLNPVIASTEGCLVVDARMAVAASPVRPLRAMRAGPGPSRAEPA